jgi:uncharacterized protein YutE (UPF0331/DUF86 family)
MTPGRVDLKVIVDRLSLVERYLVQLRQIPAASFEEFLADPRNAAATESLLRRALEALLDTARHVLAKQFAVATLEYREIARLAAERGLVRDERLAECFRQMAGFRIRLTHHYQEVTDQELYGILTGRLADIEGVRAQLASAASSLASEAPQP